MSGELLTPNGPAPAYVLDDPYWRTALYLFLEPRFARDQRIWRHVDFEQGSINFTALLRMGWSGGERRVIQAAAGLWNGSRYKVDLVDVLSGVDDAWWQRIITAAEMLRQAVR